MIPEIHDIGKLGIRGKHNFEDLEVVIRTGTWKGILEHHCSEDFRNYPKSHETFLLCLADSLASATSRTSPPRKGSMFNVFKLWKLPKERLSKPQLSSEEEIRNFLDKDPSAEEFLKEYGGHLRLRAEDASFGCNITSLYTHSVLTGKFYRILKQAFLDELVKMKINFENKKEVCRLVNEEVQRKWKLTISKCKISFPQHLHRVRDLNVLGIIEDTITQFKVKFSDNILFEACDYIIVLSKADDALHSLRELAHNYGFYLDIIQAKTRLKELKPDPSKISGSKYTTIYGNLPNTIEPPICEICQMARGEKSWVDEESGIQEHICDQCYRIRELGERHKKLASWKDTRVIWVKVSLDFEKLVDCLYNLYSRFLRDTVKLENAEKICDEIDRKEGLIKPSVVQEFYFDYEDFLKGLDENILEMFRDETVEKVRRDFYVMKVDRLQKSFKVLEEFSSLIDEYFPEFKSYGKSPIKIAISCSSEKFPFFEHWRMLNDMENDDITIIAIERGKASFNIGMLDKVLGWIKSDTPQKQRALLYRLTEISERSEKLAEIELVESRKKLTLPEIGYRDMLTIIKILSG